ncbi:DUF4156 domain-containing protein [Candidatus Methylocalor cossyra]|uniref:DUF4156 domain-containing protein n=1 Tax=Candidatus Methylocalor cossyra TaxID=3108543 RepID=A0ABM9NI44_9GAMM
MGSRSRALAGWLLVGVVAGCTWVELKPQGEKVRQLTPAEVGRCKLLGHITSNTAASIAFITRPKSSVREEVNRLARNNAGDMGGDTIVPTGPLVDGEQSFNVYRCINP